VWPPATPPPSSSNTERSARSSSSSASSPGVAYRRESDRADRLETQLLEANQRIIDRFAEVLTQTRDALRESNDYLRDMARRRS
jgi:hypothetical protein